MKCGLLLSEAAGRKTLSRQAVSRALQVLDSAEPAGLFRAASLARMTLTRIVAPL
jgi:hypothetical protein